MLDRGEWVDPRSGRSNFGEYASAWLSVKRATVAPRTYVNIEGRWRNHIEPVFGECQIASIRPIDVRKWVASMLDDGMAPDTARKVLQVLGQILRHAEIDRLIARSPIIGIELPRSAAGDEMHFLSAAEVERLARCIDARYRALIFTAAYCGLRAGELGYLRVESLDLAPWPARGTRVARRGWRTDRRRTDEDGQGAHGRCPSLPRCDARRSPPEVRVRRVRVFVT